MITITVGTLFERKTDGEADTRGHYIYVIRDKTVTLYVGKTKRGIVNRILEHCGRGERPGMDRVGMLLLENRPKSLSWMIDMLTVEDCGFDRWDYMPQELREELPDWFVPGDVVDMAEQEMMSRLHPCLNVTHNQQPQALPEYLNSALDLTSTVSDFIPF